MQSSSSEEESGDSQDEESSSGSDASYKNERNSASMMIGHAANASIISTANASRRRQSDNLAIPEKAKDYSNSSLRGSRNNISTNDTQAPLSAHGGNERRLD